MQPVKFGVPDAPQMSETELSVEMKKAILSAIEGLNLPVECNRNWNILNTGRLHQLLGLLAGTHRENIWRFPMDFDFREFEMDGNCVGCQSFFIRGIEKGHNETTLVRLFPVSLADEGVSMVIPAVRFLKEIELGRVEISLSEEVSQESASLSE